MAKTPNKPKVRYKAMVLQRFAHPVSVKGRRAHFILSELRKLIRARTLRPDRQLLALSILLYVEGFIDFINPLSPLGTGDTSDKYTLPAFGHGGPVAETNRDIALLMQSLLQVDQVDAEPPQDPAPVAEEEEA